MTTPMALFKQRSMALMITLTAEQLSMIMMIIMVVGTATVVMILMQTALGNLPCGSYGRRKLNPKPHANPTS